MSGCNTKSKCCIQPNWLHKLYCLFQIFYNAFVARFITGVEYYRNVDQQNTGNVVNSLPVRIEDYEIFNATAGLVYVKLWNKGNALPDPLVAADVAELKRTLLVPARSGANLADLNLPFPKGLAVTATLGAADSDNTSPGPANSVIVNIGYKKI